MSVTSIVSVFLDIFRPELTAYRERYQGSPPLGWAKKRIDFFREWTIRSLKNQSFQDFRIFLLCAERTKELIDSYEWDAKVEPCYDYGKAKFEVLDTDHVAVTRLDSDDLFHKDAMQIIRDNLILSDRIEKLFVSDYYRWLFYHDCIIHVENPLAIEKWSPSYTIVFPKSEYKDWPVVKKNLFVFIKKTCSNPGDNILPPDLVCMIRIKESIHHAIWKEDPLHEDRLAKELESAEMLGRKVMFSPDEHIEILKDFGISKEQYLGRKND